MLKLSVIGLAICGCTQTDSADITTHGIYADLSAHSQGNGTTTVRATLFRDNPLTLDFVNLSGNDMLIASNNGQDRVMSETNILNIVGYSTDFQTDTEGQEFAIDLQRSIDAGAPHSTATLPAKFAIDPVPSSASRAATMTVTWSPSGTTDVMSWQAQGDCIDSASQSINGDTGSVTIAAATLKKKMGQMIADSCAVQLTITRAHTGVLDPGYGKGGTITGDQDRIASFTSAP